MTTQEINFAMICGALILICLFAVGLIIHEKSQQKKNLYGNKKSPIQYKKCIGDSFLFILVPVFFVKSKHGGIYEGVQGSAFLLSWATSASCSIYESADATHL